MEPERSFSARLMVALLSLWNRKPRNKRRTHLLLAAILLIIGGAAAYIGAPPALRNSSDFPQFFDGGWRIMGSAQESDSAQAGQGFGSDGFSVHSAVCETTN